MIDNANRAGVVAYMTIQEFQRARPEDDRHVVRVVHHKTVNTHGPAQIVLTNHLYNHLKIFLKEMHSRLPLTGSAEGNAKVFLSWGGKKMESSQMSKALSSIFQKAGTDGPMSHMLYRKSAVSECHQNRKEISSNLADLMAHRESTAEKYYRVFDKHRSSVKASQMLHGMMRNAEKEELFQTGKEVEEENGKSNEDGVEEKMEELAQTGKEAEEETETSKEERVEEKMNAIKQLFGPEINT